MNYYNKITLIYLLGSFQKYFFATKTSFRWEIVFPFHKKGIIGGDKNLSGNIVCSEKKHQLSFLERPGLSTKGLRIHGQPCLGWLRPGTGSGSPLGHLWSILPWYPRAQMFSLSTTLRATIFVMKTWIYAQKPQCQFEFPGDKSVFAAGGKGARMSPGYFLPAPHNWDF